MRYIPTVPRADELLDQAFRRASKIDVRPKYAGKDTRRKINSVIDYIDSKLQIIIKKFPSFDQLHPFYVEIFDLLFSLDKARKSLGAVQWARTAIKSLRKDASTRIKSGKEAEEVRQMVYGRISSIVKRIGDDLLFLDEIRNMMRKTPALDLDGPTIVICGYPNVGKSTLIRRMTTAEPEVAPYPFTTKGIHLGHMVIDRVKVQVVDTPGLFDRPVEEMNDIEKQGVAALRFVGHASIVVMDPTETCGYQWEKQMHLLEMLKDWFDRPMVIVENKSDHELFKKRLDESITISAESADEEEIGALQKMMTDIVKTEMESQIWPEPKLPWKEVWSYADDDEDGNWMENPEEKGFRK